MRRKTRSLLRKWAVRSTVILTLSLVISCASPGITLFKLVPADGQVSTASIKSGQIVFTAQYLDAGQRALYFREKGFEILGQGLMQVPMTTFLLAVKNSSDKDFVLDPGSIRMAAGYGPLLNPYNYAHLYMELPHGSNRQRILLDLRKAIYDKRTNIAPGQSVEKLLLFERPEKVGPSVAVIFERLYTGGKEHQVTLDFKAVDLEK